MSLLSFGIPLPLNQDNVFNISKKTWLLGQVSVPEGVLSAFAKPILEADAKKIKKCLDLLFPDSVFCVSDAPRQYKFLINGEELKINSSEYKLAMANLHNVRVITLQQILGFFANTPETYSNPDFIEFLEMIGDSLPKHKVDELKEDFPFLSLVI